ncbi:TetR-like C-terminal domain-containing protein [Trujillonella endophytica]|uniref:Transcriptional regulator, TetR family n=1 Tax=Trujillonella endophytica TaxID=673521 RepID=A0A1H8VYH1_9ACTN|nr:TetR-like C-terminal domain-containing protein [Trujillella endophytica]SEP20390.1 transcriptional regulator, TetR family [Trujillella endophytica]
MSEAARGRPRDARIDEAVLAATRDLLATEGFVGTTVQAVARAAGVGASAIYRRWPSRLELIATAIGQDLDRLDVRPTGDLRADVRAFVGGYLELFDSPVARAGLPGILAASRGEGDEVRGLTRRVGQGVRPAFRAVLAAAPPGSVDPAVDPDTVFDVLIGAALYRSFIHPFTGRRGGADDVTDLLLRALRP